MHSNEWGYTLLSHGRLDGLKINTLNVLNIYCRCDLHETLRRSFYFDEIDKLPEMYLESESIHDSQNSYEEYLRTIKTQPRYRHWGTSLFVQQ